jgi:hypothetical protein
MSPKLFVYNGIELVFFSNDHLPVHVHAIYEKKYGMKVEFIKKESKIIKIAYKKLKGFKEFKPSQMRDLKKLIAEYAEQITSDWIQYFVEGEKIKTRIINKKL